MDIVFRYSDRIVAMHQGASSPRARRTRSAERAGGDDAARHPREPSEGTPREPRGLMLRAPGRPHLPRSRPRPPGRLASAWARARRSAWSAATARARRPRSRARWGSCRYGAADPFPRSGHHRLATYERALIGHRLRSGGCRHLPRPDGRGELRDRPVAGAAARKGATRAGPASTSACSLSSPRCASS
jgi:hypothetical protein